MANQSESMNLKFGLIFTSESYTTTAVFLCFCRELCPIITTKNEAELMSATAHWKLEPRMFPGSFVLRWLFSESVMCFLNLQISKQYIPKSYPELEI